MNTIMDLSMNARAVLLLVIFLQILLLITVIAVVWLRKRRVWDMIVLLLLLAVDFTALTFLSQAHVALIFGELPTCYWVLDLPTAPVVLCLLAFTVIPCLTLVREYPLWKNCITRFSVKESMDQLPVGLCFHCR